MKYIFFIFIVFLCRSQFGSISFDNSGINAVTKATVYITRANITTPTTGNITMTFPSNAYSASLLSSVTCNLSCTISGLTITIPVSAFTPAITSVVQFLIYNITNPSSCINPESYIYQMINSTGVVESINITTGGFNPGSMQSCSLTFSPNYVRKLGVATFLVTPSNPIPINGSINLLFPATWSNIVNNDAIINSSSLSCSYNGGSLLKTTLSCSPLVTGQINLPNIFNLPTNSTFSFTVNPILSLPTSNSQSSIFVMSKDQNGNTIDNYTVCTAIGPNPNIISNLAIMNPNITVSTNFTPVITFTSTDLMNQNDILKISNICNDIVPTNMNSMMIITTSSFNFSNSITLQTSLTVNSSYYGYYLPKMTSLTYANSNSAIYLTNLTFTSPTTTMPQNCLNISFYRGGFLYSTGNLSLTPIPNILNNISLIPSTSTINSNSIFTISFITTSPLSSTAIILITLPSTIVTTPYTIKPCISFGGSVNSGVKCTLTGQVLNISNIFSTNMNGQKNITISFDGVSNPQSSMPTSNFIISSYYSYNNSYVVDQDTSLIYQATPDKIILSNVSSSSMIVGATSTYTISYTTKNHLPINSYIIIGLPFGLSFLNTTVSANVTINSVTTLIYPSIINTSQTYYNQGANFTNLTQNVIAAGTTIQFVISSIINPNSTAPSNSFSIFSYYKQYLIESIVSGLTITMTSAAQFIGTSITPNSAINGDSTYYLLSFQVSLDHNTPCILVLTIPSQINLSSNCTCNSLAGFTTNLSINCILSGNILNISLNDVSGVISASKMYTIQIIGFTNPRTYTTSSQFIISTLSNNYLINQGSINGITNNQPNSMLNFTSTVISPTQSYLNSSQTIFFNLTTKNGLNTSDYLILYFPTVYTYTGNSNTSVCAQVNIVCIPMSSNNLAVKITGNSTFNFRKSLTFTITGYTSPSSILFINMVSYFTISSFQVNNNPIDITNSNNIYTKTTFTVTCNTTLSPCQTCSTTNLSSCLTCYPLTITNSAYFQNNSCVSNCTSGFFPNSNYTCTACISPCKTCMSATYCLSCYNSSITIYISLDNTTNRCIQNCPNGYYAQPLLSYICVLCNQICLTCSYSSNNCTSCNSTYVFYNYSCLTTCPTGTYNMSNSCFNCDISCYSCISTASNCIICTNGYFRSGVSNFCTNTCNTGTALYNGVCQCSSSCVTCNIFINNCTTCNSSSNYPYLYIIANSNNSCVLNCPAGTYTNGVNCTICPQGCSICDASLKCSSCNGIFSYFNGSCIINCPAGTVTTANICTACLSPCLTCSSIISNCTSCVNNYSLDGNVCTKNCSNNAIGVSSSNGLICTACNSSCLKCSITINNCTSCATQASLYNGYLCVLTCPNTFVSVNKICQSCASPCSNCANTPNNCLSCLSGYYIFNSTNNITCLTSCPSNYYANGTMCITCQAPCSTCAANSAQNCTSCISGYLLENNHCLVNCSVGFINYQGKCLNKCPDGYSLSNNTCAITEPIILPTKTIPVPFVIAAIILLLLVFGSKLIYTETFVPSLTVSLWSLLQILSWFTIIIMTSLSINTQYKYYGINCFITALILHYILNALNLYFIFKYIKSDEIFQKWYKSQGNPYLNMLVIILATILNHQFFHFIFSKGFSTRYLKAPLSNPAQFTPINIISGLSLIPSIIFLVGISLVAYDITTILSSQLFMECVDSIIITILTILCTLWNIKKPYDTYFNEEQIKKYQIQQTFQNHQTVEELVADNNIHGQTFQEEVGDIRGRKATYSSLNSVKDNSNRLQKTNLNNASINAINLKQIEKISNRSLENKKQTQNFNQLNKTNTNQLKQDSKIESKIFYKRPSPNQSYIERQVDSKLRKTISNLNKENLTKQIDRRDPSQKQKKETISEILLRKQSNIEINQSSSEFISQEPKSQNRAKLNDVQCIEKQNKSKLSNSKLKIEEQQVGVRKISSTHKKKRQAKKKNQKDQKSQILNSIKKQQNSALKITQNEQKKENINTLDNISQIQGDTNKKSEQGNQSIMNKLKLSHFQDNSGFGNQEQKDRKIIHTFQTNLIKITTHDSKDNQIQQIKIQNQFEGDQNIKKKESKQTKIQNESRIQSKIQQMNKNEQTTNIRKIISNNDQSNIQEPLIKTNLQDQTVNINLDKISQLRKKKQIPRDTQQDENLVFISKTNVGIKSQEIPPKRFKRNIDTSSESIFLKNNKTSVLKNMTQMDSIPTKPIMKPRYQRQPLIKQIANKKFKQQGQQYQNIDESYVFQNEISPSQFNLQNQRYENQLIKQSPPKKSVIAPIQFKTNQINYNFKMKDNNYFQHEQPNEIILNRREIQNQQEHPTNKPPRSGSTRYEGMYLRSNNIDNENKQKSLQKIYLQRIDGKNQVKKRKVNNSANYSGN